MIRRRLTDLAGSDVGITLGYSVGVRVVAALSSIAAARNLGPDGFGAFTYFISTGLLISLLCSGGLQNAVNKYFASEQPTSANAKRVLNLFTGAIALACGLAGVASFCSTILTPSSAGIRSADQLQVASIIAYSASTALQSLLIGAVSGLGLHRQSAKLSGVCATTNALVVCVFSLPSLSAHIIGAVAWTNAICLLSIRRAVFALAGNLAAPPRKAETPLYQYFRFGIFSIAGGLVVQTLTWLASHILSLQHNGFEQLGLLGIALQFRQFVLFVPVALGNWLLSTYSRSEKLNAGHSSISFEEVRRQRIAKLITHLKYISILTAFICILIIMAAPTALHAMGRQYAAATPITYFIVLSSAILSISNVLSKFLQGLGRVAATFYLDVVWSIAFGAVFFGFFAEPSALSIAVSFTAAATLQTIGQLFYIWKLDRATE